MIPRGHLTMLGFARRSAVFALLAIGLSTVEGETFPAMARLDDVVVERGLDATSVHVKTSTSRTYHASLIDTPTRLVIDFDDTAFAWRAAPLDVDAAPLRQVRASQYSKDVARVVLEFTGAVQYSIHEQADGLVIIVPRVY